MRMIFNHEDGQQVTQRGIIAAAQNRLKVEKQLQEMREREIQEENEILQRSTKDKKVNSSDEKLIGKRAMAVHKFEQSASKKQRQYEESESDESQIDDGESSCT